MNDILHDVLKHDLWGERIRINTVLDIVCSKGSNERHRGAHADDNFSCSLSGRTGATGDDHGR